MKDPRESLGGLVSEDLGVGAILPGRVSPWGFTEGHVWATIWGTEQYSSGFVGGRKSDLLKKLAFFFPGAVFAGFKKGRGWK